MQRILCFVLFIVSHFTRTDGAVLHPLVITDRNVNPMSTEHFSNNTHFTWILSPPWKHHNDPFNDKPTNHSAEYFLISREDHITSESYIETSKLTVCKDVNLTFYSRVHHSLNKINLILFTYQRNTWNKAWEYIHNDSQWQLHQLSINVIDPNETIQLRFLPHSNSSDQIFIGITIPKITTHANCDTFNQRKSPLKNSSQHRSTSTFHVFLFAIFGSIFLLLFLTVMAGFIYGLISKQYNRWIRKRSSRRRRKGRRTRNVIRDESTIIRVETETV